MSISSAIIAGDAKSVRERLVAAIAAMCLGLVIIYGAAFAEQPLHNAAHDSRHSFAFACH